MKNSIIAILILILLTIGLLFLCSYCEHYYDNEVWNNGMCQCGGKWEYQQAVGHRYSTNYIYKCNKCGAVIETYEFRKGAEYP